MERHSGCIIVCKPTENGNEDTALLQLAHDISEIMADFHVDASILVDSAVRPFPLADLTALRSAGLITLQRACLHRTADAGENSAPSVSFPAGRPDRQNSSQQPPKSTGNVWAAPCSSPPRLPELVGRGGCCESSSTKTHATRSRYIATVQKTLEDEPIAIPGTESCESCATEAQSGGDPKRCICQGERSSVCRKPTVCITMLQARPHLASHPAAPVAHTHLGTSAGNVNRDFSAEQATIVHLAARQW